MKLCKRCNTEKSLDDFFINSRRSDGRQTYCKPCQLEYQRARYAKPEVFQRRAANLEIAKERRKGSSRKWYLKSTYGITVEQYEELFNKNDGKCYICNSSVNYWLHVDHDHSCCPTNKSCGNCIRGLLCYNCNTMLGYAKDSIDVLRRATDYIVAHNNT